MGTNTDLLMFEHLDEDLLGTLAVERIGLAGLDEAFEIRISR